MMYTILGCLSITVNRGDMMDNKSIRFSVISYFDTDEVVSSLRVFRNKIK